MARKYTQVQVTIWDDLDFLALDGDAQRLYFLLLTRIDLSLAGVIPWHSGRLAQFAKDSTPEAIEAAAAKLEAARFIIIDRDTEECLLRSRVRNDDVLRAGPRVAGGVVTAWRAIYSRRLRAAAAEEVARAEELTEAVRGTLAPILEWARETPSHALPDTPSDTPSEEVSEGVSPEVSRKPETRNQKIEELSSAHAAEFEAWWKTYPRRVGKGQARRAYSSALKKTTADQLADAAEAFAARVHESGTEERFIPHPATWLNGERWADAAPPPVAGPTVMVAANGTQQEVTW